MTCCFFCWRSINATAIAHLLGELFVVVKYLGGACLIWLGIRLWRRLPTVCAAADGLRRPGPTDIGAGLLINLANPKVMLFCLGLLPTVVDIGALSTGDVVALTAVVAAVPATVLTVCAYSADRAGQPFSRRMLVHRGAAGLMVTAGTLLIARN